MAKNRPFVEDLYWFPERMLDMDKVQGHFSLNLAPGGHGEYREEPEETRVEMYRRRFVKGRPFVGLPRGRPDLVRKCLIDSRKFKSVEDRTSNTKAKLKFKMVGRYRPYQKKAIEEMAKHETGILTAPPRMGKTVMATGLVLAKQRKTLVLAHQTDLLEQFLNQTIMNGDLFDGALAGKNVAGICRTFSDFKRHSICLATYQTFLSSGGERLLDRIKDMFGMVFVDEAHRTPATRYTRILSRFSARHMHGCTATPDRKDNLYVVADRVLGPIRHSIGREDVLSPKVYGHRSGFSVPKRGVPKSWNAMMTMLYSNGKRNRTIASAAVFDVANGHHVLIPVNRNKWGRRLKDMIDAKAGREVCFLFNGTIPKSKRQEARDRMRFDPDVKVTIATRSMLLGVDCPDWSAVYTVAPISNPPTYTQEIFRVCTPMTGKRRPIIRYFADHPLGISYGCFASCDKVLSDPAHGFHLTEKYEELARMSRRGRSGGSSGGTHRPSHGMNIEPPKVRRF